MRIVLAIIACLVTWFSTYYYYEAQIERMRREFAVEKQKLAEENQKAIYLQAQKAKEQYENLNAEKEAIRKSLTDAKSDNRRMQYKLSKLSNDKDRATIIRERDEFAGLATEANGLLIEADEALRIINATDKTRKIDK